MAIGKFLTMVAASAVIVGSTMAFNLNDAQMQRQKVNEANDQTQQTIGNYKNQLEELKSIISRQTHDLSVLSRKFNAPELWGDEVSNYMVQADSIRRDIYKMNWYVENIALAPFQDELDEIDMMNQTLNEANGFVDEFDKDIEDIKAQSDLAVADSRKERSKCDILISDANAVLDEIDSTYKTK